jgi:dephospho-CoA kinase
VKTLGLTGGVGMGKSATADLLRQRGLPVLDTDDLARQVVSPGQPALREIVDAFGAGILNATGQLRRVELAKLVFANLPQRRLLESILHPRIRTLWKNQLAQWQHSAQPAAVVVIPLLFETQAEPEFDAVVCVACSAATQADRLKSRGWSAAETTQRIQAQWPIDQKIARAHFVLWNEADHEVLGEQVDRVLQRMGLAPYR